MRFGSPTDRAHGAAGQASSRILATVAAHALSVCLLTSNGLSGGLLPPAFAGAPPLNDEQKLAANAWKETDRIFVDRTFGDQDWFKRREKLLKATKTGGREETYDEIRAMLKSVDDKYTRFLTPAMYDAVYSVATGDVAGVGCELAAEPRADGKGTEITFTTIFEGSPAEAAGLKAGDVLLAVDGNPLSSSISAEETSGKVRGVPGTKVSLQLRRVGAAADAKELIIITRGKVKIDAVSSSVTGKVGLIRIRNFSTTTADDVKKALEALLPKGINKLVIDLRGNTGGYFPGGVDVARLLLPDKTDISFVNDYKGAELSYSTYSDGMDLTTPVYLLVDAKTASASEILASALQDNKRAQLVGSKTYGKAVIQNVGLLSDGSAVVVTTARYQTPLRHNINQIGLFPDIKRDCELGSPALECLGNVP